MQAIILTIQTFLARNGAPEWLLNPSAWIALTAAFALIVVILRSLLRRSAEAAPEPAPPLTISKHPPRPEAPAGGVFGAWTEAFASQIPESEKEHREFGAILKQAGFYSKTARASIYAYRFLLLVFPIVCAGILAIAAPPDQSWKILIGGGIVAAILSIIPRLFVWHRRRARLTQINGGLADMLDMLSMCLGGGMSISASLEHVAKNLTNYPALADEVAIMRRQSDVGSLRTALVDFANRIDTPEVRQVSTLLARGEALGTSLSGSLLDQADHFRTAKKQLATLQANRMPVLLTFPLLFCFAPAVLIVLMSPAFLQVSEFLNPQNGDNPLANNGTINTQNIVNTLNGLDQNVSAANRRTPARPVAVVGGEEG